MKKIRKFNVLRVFFALAKPLGANGRHGNGHEVRPSLRCDSFCQHRLKIIIKILYCRTIFVNLSILLMLSLIL